MVRSADSPMSGRPSSAGGLMAAARRRKAPSPDPGSAGRRLAQTIAFHRWTLATPIDDHFMTPEQRRQMPLPPEPAPQSRKAEQYLITRVTCTLEVPSEERLSILAAARWPLAGIVTLTQGKRTRTVLAPRSEEHTSELHSRSDLVCRLLLEKKTRLQPLSTKRGSNSRQLCVARDPKP